MTTNTKQAPTRAKSAAKPIATRTTKKQAKAEADPVAKGKVGAMLTLLRKPKGASLAELMQATGWQAHSVRGALSGTVKKKLGLALISTRENDTRLYRVEA